MIVRGRIYDNKVNIIMYICSNNNDGYVGLYYFLLVGSLWYLIMKFKGRENINNDIIYMKKVMILVFFKGVLLIFFLGFCRKIILWYFLIVIIVMY